MLVQQRLPNPAETLILQRDDIPKRQTSESNQIISVSPTPGCPPIDGQRGLVLAHPHASPLTFRK